MSTFPDLAIYAPMRDAEDYAEVFLRSAAVHGGSNRYRVSMSILVGDSTDNTLDVCRRYFRNLVREIGIERPVTRGNPFAQ